MIVLGGIAGTIIGIFTFSYFKEIGKNKFNYLSILYVRFGNNWNSNVDRGSCRNR